MAKVLSVSLALLLTLASFAMTSFAPAHAGKPGGGGGGGGGHQHAGRAGGGAGFHGRDFQGGAGGMHRRREGAGQFRDDITGLNFRNRNRIHHDGQGGNDVLKRRNGLTDFGPTFGMGKGLTVNGGAGNDSLAKSNGVSYYGRARNSMPGRGSALTAGTYGRGVYNLGSSNPSRHAIETGATDKNMRVDTGNMTHNKTWTGNTESHILPYIEHDNIYNSSQPKSNGVFSVPAEFPSTGRGRTRKFIEGDPDQPIVTH